MARVFFNCGFTCVQVSEVTSSVLGHPARSLTIEKQSNLVNFGLALSPDGTQLAVSQSSNSVSVYSTRDWSHFTYGESGEGEGQFSGPRKLCFMPGSGHVLVADQKRKCLHEFAPEAPHGRFVRFIGAGVITHEIWGVAASPDLIAVGKFVGTNDNRILLFDAVTGAFVRSFHGSPIPAHATDPQSQLGICLSVRFTPDYRHIVVAERDVNGARVSMFTLGGERLQQVGVGELQLITDVAFADNGDIIVGDFQQQTGHRVCVFSPDGTSLVRHWLAKSDGVTHPVSLSVHSGQLYVLDHYTASIAVFE